MTTTDMIINMFVFVFKTVGWHSNRHKQVEGQGSDTEQRSPAGNRQQSRNWLHSATRMPSITCQIDS